MSKPIMIGTRNFSSRKAAEAFFLEMRDRYKTGSVVDDEADINDLKNLLQLHPERAEKIGSGIRHFLVDTNTGGTRSFYVARNDDTRDDFSIGTCIKGYR